MPMPEEPTLGEIGRNIAAIRDDIRALRAGMVMREVYEAHRETTNEQIRRLEAEIAAAEADKVATRRMVYGAVLTAVLAIVANIVLFVLTAP